MKATDLLEMIGDKDTAEILHILQRSEFSALDIVRKTNVPPGNVYRKLRALKSAGFIEERDRILTKEGKRVWIFKSTVKTIHIYYTEPKLKIVIEKKDGRKLIFED